MQILVLLGMYFAAVVVFVTSQTLLFRLALAILCTCIMREDLGFRARGTQLGQITKSHQKLN